MQCYTQLTPPTAVSHSVSLPFLSASANNLVVAKASLLQVFSFKSVISEHDSDLPGASASSPDQALRRTERVPTTKLVLVSQYELSGAIISLGRVKILRSKSGGEALLVALKDAKLSLVEWDPERYSISTVSIHYYEREDLRGCPWAPDVGSSVNYLIVDPRSRCAALKFGVRNVAILPFHQAGDDLVMDDYDPELDGDLPERTTSPTTPNKEVPPTSTPYAASFVLSLLTLDPSLSLPVHLAFLYEYREPTFGILSSEIGSSSALLQERKDMLSYTVFTLDLEQRASTTLLSVSDLPYDLHTVVPLTLPVGGALLVGNNEIIHVDQAGKTNGVAVNEFAKQCSSFSLSDQADLGLKLEGSIVERFGTYNGEMLIIMKSGELATLGFKIDGRSVSGLSIQLVTRENGGSLIRTGASCASVVGRGRLFVGSETGDSIVLGWSRRSDKLKRQRSRVTIEIDGDVEASEMDEEESDEDDLYSSAKADRQTQNQVPASASITTADEAVFRIHDSLQNLAPLKDIAFGKCSPLPKAIPRTSSATSSQLDLVVTTGQGGAGGLVKMKREIDPSTLKPFELKGAQNIWSVCASRNNVNDTAVEGKIESLNSLDDEHDRFVITSGMGEAGELQSHVYAMDSGALEELKESDFDPSAGATVEIGTLNNGTRVVQVLGTDLRTFDGDFGLAQIFPLYDEATGAEPKVISASFAEPYILLIRDDFAATVLKADEESELDEVERGEALSKNRWVSGSLYEDSNDVFRLELNEEDEGEGRNVLAFLLNREGELKIFRLPNLNDPVYVANGLSFLPPFLSPDFTVRRSAARETVTEILVAELGDAVSKSPYMILRSENDDLTIYQPYQCPVATNSDTVLRFFKVSNPHLPRVSDEDLSEDAERRYQPLRAIQDLGGYSAVFLPGPSPSFVIKSSSCLPQVINLREGAVTSLSSLHIPGCKRGYIYIDAESSVFSAQLPQNCEYGTGWVTSRIFSGEEVQSVDYHGLTNCYLLGISSRAPFKLPEDELHYEWSLEEVSLLPEVEQGSLRLLDASTWKTADRYSLDPAEVVMCIKTMNLEISENTHARRELLTVGTALLQGEDLPAQGRIYIFDIINVVPEPDHPETGRKLKLIAKEEVKGAVTALSEIGTQGFLIAAQGQKCMVRGLKEDSTLLPVAFMDMQCYVSSVQELKGTGLCVTGDAIKGVWFTGYTEEPYQLRLFSKSSQRMEVLAANFLPDGQQLYIVVLDADSIMHILQFDPEHPKSLSGHLLLPLSTISTNSTPHTLTLLPSIDPSPHPHPQSPPPPSPPRQSLLLTSPTGSLSLLTPLSYPTYRLLSALQSYLTATLPHPLGLNPRAHRAAEANLSFGGRAVVDGDVLRRWMELGSWKREEGESRCVGEGGGEGDERVRRALESVGGRGLGFL